MAKKTGNRYFIILVLCLLIIGSVATLGFIDMTKPTGEQVIEIPVKNIMPAS